MMFAFTEVLLFDFFNKISMILLQMIDELKDLAAQLIVFIAKDPIQVIRFKMEII